MGKYVLENDVTIATPSGTATFRKGRTVDEVTDDVARLRQAGARLLPLVYGDAAATAAIALAKERKGQIPGVDLGADIAFRDQLAPNPGWGAQPAWFVDGLNTTKLASDLNDGLTAGTPLLTDAELFYRLGAQPITASTVVAFISLPPKADPVRADIFIEQRVPTTQVKVRIIGPAMTQKKTGALSAVTVRVRSTNTPWLLTDAGAAFDATDLGLRVRITSGARTGARFYVATVPGATTIRVSEPVIPNFPVLANTYVTPAAPDPYEILTAPGVLYVDFIRVRANGGLYPNQPTVQFEDLDLSILGRGAFSESQLLHSACSLVFANCRWIDKDAGGGRLILSAEGKGTANTWAFFTATNIEPSSTTGFQFSCQNAGNTYANQFDACLVRGTGTQPAFVAEGDGAAAVTGTLFQGTFVLVVRTGSFLTEDSGHMDWPALGLSIGGIIVASFGAARQQSFLYGLSGLWGASAVATTVGVQGEDDATFTYADGTKLYIAGAAAVPNAMLGGRSSVEAFDTATGTWSVAPAARTLTWTNITGTIAAGGHANNAHDMTHNARIYKARTTLV